MGHEGGTGQWVLEAGIRHVSPGPTLRHTEAPELASSPCPRYSGVQKSTPPHPSEPAPPSDEINEMNECVGKLRTKD